MPTDPVHAPASTTSGPARDPWAPLRAATRARIGLGLTGARRLMDEFAVVSEVDRGTTVTMTKWQKEGTA